MLLAVQAGSAEFIRIKTSTALTDAYASSAKLSTVLSKCGLKPLKGFV